jgi:tight adherence protein B
MTIRGSLLRTAARVGATLTVVGLVLAPTAAMALDGSIAHVEAKPGSLKVLVSVPADADVDLDGVTVTVDGEDAEATAAPIDSDSTVKRTAVLAIDTSNSMAGGRFFGAKSAAREFISSVPADVRVGIVTFAGEVTTVLPPGQDRAGALAMVDGLTLSKGTRLYDGVIQAVDLLGDEGQRSLLVLSDGADTSDTPIESATTAIKDADVLTDVVSLELSGTALQALQELATAGQGQVISSDPAALRAAFAAEADVLARQVLVEATLPAGFARRWSRVRRRCHHVTRRGPRRRGPSTSDRWPSDSG